MADGAEDLLARARGTVAVGLRIALGAAIAVCLIAEIKFSRAGLGAMVIDSFNRSRFAEVYAVLIVIISLAIGGNGLVDRVGRRRRVARTDEPIVTGSSNLSLYEVNEAAEAIKEAADPEANIIFGTSFNERLGEEVMVTVIATGFDGGKKRQTAHREATGVMDTSTTGRASHERDFLEELQRQRQEADGGSPFTTPVDDDAAAVVSAPRVERSVGDAAPPPRQTTYDADDLEIPSFLRRSDPRGTGRRSSCHDRDLARGRRVRRGTGRCPGTHRGGLREGRANAR